MVQQSIVIEDDTIEEKKPFFSAKRSRIRLVLLAVVLLLAALIGSRLRRYHDYTVKTTYARGEATETTYVGFQGNLLKYSRDGAFYTKYNGDLIWNYTYEMSNPKMDVSGNYILIYDMKGTQVSILTNTGFKQSIKTAMPIVDANIASQGTVAILMQEGDTGYVQLWDAEGNTLASGELHMENSGFPIALDISEKGDRLVVSQIDLNGGNVKTTIAFYDFGKDGQDKVDNIIATYSYADQVFPEIHFMENDRVVAFGDAEVVVFNNNAKVSVDKEIFVDGEIKSVFFDDKFFGMICSVTDEAGDFVNQMTIYSSHGRKTTKKNVEIPYTKVEMLGNHELCLSNGKEVAIYSLQGIKKFAYSFDTSIYKIISGDSSRRYYFIKEDSIEGIRLK